MKKSTKILIVIVLSVVNLILIGNTLVGELFPREGVYYYRDDDRNNASAMLGYMRGIKNGVFVEWDTLDRLWSYVNSPVGKQHRFEWRSLDYHGFTLSKGSTDYIVDSAIKFGFEGAAKQFNLLPTLDKNMFTLISNGGQFNAALSLIGVSAIFEDRIYANIIPIYGDNEAFYKDIKFNKSSCASKLEEIPAETYTLTKDDTLNLATIAFMGIFGR